MIEEKILQLFWLLFAHLLGDFAFQQNWMIQQKMKDPWTMVAHCFIWTGAVAVALQFFGILFLWKILFLFVGHLICDYCKHTIFDKLNDHLKNTIDQSFHLIQIIIVWAL